MRFGTWLPANGPSAHADGLTRIACTADELGFDFLRTSDHLVLPKVMHTPYPFGDGRIDFSNGINDLFTALTFVAARTTRIDLHIGCTVIALRSPFSTAQHVATMDHLSGGRTRLEVGVGWLRDEYDVLGIPWTERGGITDEYLEVIRTLFEGDGPFEGRYVSFPEVWFRPKPVRRPYPVYVAGGTVTAALRRVARFGQGWTPAIATLDEITAALPRLRALMEEFGRGDDPIDIQYRINDVRASNRAERDRLRRLIDTMESAGITSVCVNFADMMRNPDLDEIIRAAEWFASTVVLDAPST